MITPSPLISVWISAVLNSLVPIIAYFIGGKLFPLSFIFWGSLTGFAFFVLSVKEYRIYFRKDLFFKFAGIGFFGSVLPIVLMLAALEFTSPSNIAILLQSEALYSIVLSRLLLKEKTNLKIILAASLIALGTGIILFRERVTFRWKGDLVALLIPLFYQTSHIISKKLPRSVSHSVLASARALFASLTSLPLALVFSGAEVISGFNSKTFLLVILYGLAIMFVNNTLWYKAILNMDLSKATGIVLTYPAFTMLISSFAGIEKIQPYQIIGFLFSMCGAFWLTKISRNSSKCSSRR